MTTHKQSLNQSYIQVYQKCLLEEDDLHQIHSSINIMKNLCHTNIERLLDYFESVDSIHMCLEYHNGGKLKPYLITIDPEHKESSIRDIALKIANGLQYLHEHGVILRNLETDSIHMTNLTSDAVPRITRLE